MSYEIKNDKLLREAYEAGRREGLNEQGPMDPGPAYSGRFVPQWFPGDPGGPDHVAPENPAILDPRAWARENADGYNVWWAYDENGNPVLLKG